MTSILRLIAIIGTALTILGWSLVAAQTPNAAVERAARQFRIETYQRFRTHRAVYDQRIVQAQRLVDQWQARGASAGDARHVLKWLQHATRATRTSDELPPLPLLDQQPSRTLPEDVSEADLEGVVVKAVPDTPVPSARSTQIERLLPASPAGPDLHFFDAPIAAPLILDRVRSSTAALDPQIARHLQAPLLNRVAPPLYDPGMQPGPSIGSKATDSRAFDIENSADLSRTSISRKPNIAAQFVRSAEPRAAVDLDLLKQRIKDHNLSVQAIEDQLSRRDDWTLAAIEAVVDQIDALLQRREVWLLYLQVIRPWERASLESLERLDPSFELLSQRLFEAEVAYTTERSAAATLESEEGFLGRLVQLRHKVNQWKKTP